MVLDISAEDLRRDLVTYWTSTRAIFPAFPAPEVTLHAWERTHDGPGTHTLEPRDDLRAGVSRGEGAQEMDMVWTHLHFLSGDVVVLGHSSKKLLDPLLSLALQDVTAIRGRPDQGIQVS